MRLTFNENDLTIGDLEDFEAAVGMQISEALRPVTVRDDEGNVVRDPETGRPEQTVSLSAKALKGLVWIAKRQEDPAFTLEDARSVKVTELDIVRADDDEAADPKE